jgi:hypothetical protein
MSRVTQEYFGTGSVNFEKQEAAAFVLNLPVTMPVVTYELSLP